jgi:hypothetical protein
LISITAGRPQKPSYAQPHGRGPGRAGLLQGQLIKIKDPRAIRSQFGRWVVAWVSCGCGGEGRRKFETPAHRRVHGGPSFEGGKFLQIATSAGEPDVACRMTCACFHRGRMSFLSNLRSRAWEYVEPPKLVQAEDDETTADQIRFLSKLPCFGRTQCRRLDRPRGVPA